MLQYYSTAMLQYYSTAMLYMVVQVNTYQINEQGLDLSIGPWLLSLLDTALPIMNEWLIK